MWRLSNGDGPRQPLTYNQMEAGSDTTASTLLSFILALTKYPEVMRKAQEELDQLCGTERSPAIEDFGKLPYLTACMTEVKALFSSTSQNYSQ